MKWKMYREEDYYSFTPKFSTKTVPASFNPVFSFGKGHAPSSSIPRDQLKSILGGKGANLGLMSEIGLNVPPGFTITTEVCASIQETENLSEEVWKSCLQALQILEKDFGKSFGDKNSPLLLSVRSGAAISMPGMMDTVLNLGINDETLEALSFQFGERFALDSYRRVLNMFGEVVLGIPFEDFEKQLTLIKSEAGIKDDNELSVTYLKKLVGKYKAVYVEHGKIFPQNPLEQLYQSVMAVFKSWGSERCKTYRQVEKIPKSIFGTAVNVQAMVFGNTGETSGTGVCFTRNPNTGEKKLYGEYLTNAQGEDVRI